MKVWLQRRRHLDHLHSPGAVGAREKGVGVCGAKNFPIMHYGSSQWQALVRQSCQGQTHPLIDFDPSGREGY